ncbi:sigma-70 family RNA polymerase sigma factor [Actinokineospora bangkokensis]|uniref:RNA polymerase subunit sigma-70 n=1 Tax=Actinokineospora bangkokensis TaxID=1193682 RepID=A0A1Q9LQW7_9PSEU|nr:sigma-70 family RNA polymerase sigma factor [Actinokineospora bangkokensis]OLR94412.1 RNA polymerase subunit sigma-70 [Actinokineospora bangkokensis]
MDRTRRRGADRARPDLAREDELRAAYDAHAAELHRYARRQLGDDGAARDVVQEVFLRAWRAADRFDPEVASLRVWLFAIARNAVIDHERGRRVRPLRLLPGDELSALAESEADFVDDVVVGWVLEEALRRLSQEHRTALVETYLRGRPHDQVAAELGVPVGTVRSRVFYGLKALRLAMDEIGVQL